MSLRRLLVRSLLFHWRTNLSVLLGCVIAGSVLTGALFVGDSMRFSLRAMALERLGKIDHALIGSRFFRQRLADELRQSSDAPIAVAASCIFLRATVEGSAGGRAADANVVGVTPAFFKLFPETNPGMANEIILNDELALEIDAKVGDRIILRVAPSSPIPKEGLMGERGEPPLAIPVRVERIISARHLGRFSPDTTQRVPRNVFVPIEQLADRLDQKGRANALFVSAQGDVDAQTDRLRKALAAALTLDDYGIELRVSEPLAYLSIESHRKVVEPAIESAVRDVAQQLQRPVLPVLTYLANTISVGEREVPYSIVTGLEVDPSNPLAQLATMPAGQSLQAGDLFLNQWSADSLSAKVGDQVRLEYYVVADDGSLATVSHSFRLAGIVAMEGLALDRDFTPNYPGISDARTFGDWDPPFPVNLRRIHDVDEDYWEKYRTAPKAFVSLETAQQLWTTRFGRLTSLRVAPPAGVSVEQFRKDFSAALLKRLSPADAGLTFQSLKRESLAASSGSTDFSVLFLSFSSFLILSAALLVGLLFRLGAERRANELGVLLTSGMTAGQVRGLLLFEGLVLCGLGSLLGLLGAVGYARLMILALTTWWKAAVNTPFISFHATASSAGLGWIASVVVAAATIAWAVWKLGRVPVPLLLSRGATFASNRRPVASKRSGILAVVGLIGGVSLIAASPWINQMAAFFGGGMLLLVGALSWFAALLERRARTAAQRKPASAVAALGARNTARYPARSVLTASLLAFATFVVVSVGAMRHGEPPDLPIKSSGNGGFSLVAQSAAPLFLDLAVSENREEIGISGDLEPLLAQQQIVQFSVRPGDDASCQNIYQPRNPTLLGARPEFIERGGFSFAQSLASTEDQRQNPWRLLAQPFPDGAIPAVGDANTLQWIVKKKIGEDLAISNEFGQPIKLRIVAALRGSIFQSELLISDANLRRHFPSIEGARFWLLTAPRDKVETIATGLENDLADFGFDVTTTQARLAGFKAIENTYMATFQALGGLGLLLGTLGLVVVLLRNVLERRGELALLRAVGFPKRSLDWLILVENLILMAVGLGVGTACAAVAVVPQLLTMERFSQLLPLGGILLAVLLVGFAGSALATKAALRSPLLEALRSD